MDSKQAEEILLKYKAGTATDKEKAWVETWYNRMPVSDLKLSDEQVAADQAASWAVFEREYASRTKVSKLWPRMAVAAAAVAAIVFGVWFFNGERAVVKQVQDEVAYKNDIVPGKNTATITLANGKTINLSDQKSGVVINEDKLVYNDGTDISDRDHEFSSGSRTGEAAMLTASTPLGGTYQVILPDGSKVWLNAASSIKFPSSFAGLKQRNIELSGEAYFEIAKDKAHPFIVSTDQQKVEVLGTHFNINAYTDEGSVKTTLLEGSVRVAARYPEDTRHPEFISGSRNSKTELQGSRSASGQAVGPDLRQDDVVLKPNEQAALATTGKIKVSQIDPELAVAWKNNQFIFESDNIQYIMRMISRWYNVEVEYVGEIPTDGFGGAVSKFENVSEVLKPLEATGKVRFIIEGRRIKVMK